MPTSRARPLPPAQRRAALIDAVLPLVRARGMSVTTRELAEASGVAEGTIFRVFPDKEALVRAAVDAAMDPAQLLDDLRGVDVALPLRDRLVVSATILQRRLIDVISLVTALQLPRPPGAEQARREDNNRINTVMVALVMPDRAAFRCPPTEVVRLMRLLTFAGSHPLLADGALLTPKEIVALLLDGVLVHHETDGVAPTAETHPPVRSAKPIPALSDGVRC